ncbi:hypothetical protein FKM82_016190 [Ascaphus truei]
MIIRVCRSLELQMFAKLVNIGLLPRVKMSQNHQNSPSVNNIFSFLSFFVSLFSPSLYLWPDHKNPESGQIATKVKKKQKKNLCQTWANLNILQNL